MILEFDPYATSDLQNLIIFPNIHVIGCKKKNTIYKHVQCAMCILHVCILFKH